MPIDYRGDTYRVVYTPMLEGTVCVLDAFKKKSWSGKATPKHLVDRVEERLKWAQAMHAGGRLPSQNG